VSRSKRHIEELLDRYGCDAFACGWDRTTRIDTVQFAHQGLRFALSICEPEDDPSGQKLRARWRTLLLVIQAKLAAADSGLSTFEQEFLSCLVRPDGLTLGAALIPNLRSLAEGAPLDRLLTQQPSIVEQRP
jgi:hypothetical protein